MKFGRWLITLMIIVLVTDISILLDIPVLRPILGFLCFTTIPGLLILYVLKLNEISILKRFLLSVGLSISFLIFVGLSINELLPWFGYSKPLSTFPLILFFSLALVVLCFIAYLRNKSDIQFTLSSEFSQSIKNERLSLLLFPFLFPLLSVIGRYLTDTSGNNKVLILMFLLIPLYIVLLTWQNKKVSEATYPIAIGMISIALLLSRGLISDYLIGGDIYSEYNSFQVVSKNLHWSIAAAPNTATASLSVSLLPQIFQSILGINPLYIFKAVFLILTSLVPVIGYVIYRGYVGIHYGFLSSIFFMAQLPFIYLLSGHLRVGIALVSFSLALMVLLDNNFTGLNKRILFLIFLISLVVEYYVLPVLFLGLMFCFWLIPKITKKSPQTLSTTAAIILPFILIFFWWGQLTATAFNEYIFFTSEILINLSNMFVEELYSPTVTALFTPAQNFPLIMQVPGIVQRITIFITAIGVVSILIMREQRVKFSNYAFLIIPCFALLLAEIILPKLGFKYGADRLYIQLLVILAPAFIVGSQAIFNICIYLFRFIRPKDRPRYKHTHPTFNLQLIIIVILIICQFFSTSFLYHQLLGFPAHEILDTESEYYTTYYVYESEVVAANWLGANNINNLPIYMGNRHQPGSGDVFEYTEYGVDKKFSVSGFRKKPFAENSYVFLAYLNIIEGRVHTPYIEKTDSYDGPPLLIEYICFFAEKNKIYDNNSSSIYR